MPDKKVVRELTGEMKQIIEVCAKAFYRDNPEDYPDWRGWYKEFSEGWVEGTMSEAFLRNCYEWNDKGFDPGVH